MYEIRFLEAAARDLEKLDARVAQRIAERLRRLSANVDEVRLEALTGDLKGPYKLRAGDYRVIYELLRDEQVSLSTVSAIVVTCFASADTEYGAANGLHLLVPKLPFGNAILRRLLFQNSERRPHSCETEVSCAVRAETEVSARG